LYDVVTGLSHEQLHELRGVVQELGKQGHSLTPSTKAVGLLTAHAIMTDLDVSFDAAIKTTSHALNTSPNTLRAAAKEVASTGTLSHRDSGETFRSNPSHPFYMGESGPSLTAELILHRLLHDVKLENTFESCNTLRAALEAEAAIVVSKDTIRLWLHALGYQYGKKNFINNSTFSYRNALIRTYIYNYSRALKEQEAGAAIIVYMDESYIHAHHCSKSLWYSLSSSTKNDVRGDDKGKRIIIMHAMTKDGLLEVEGVEPSNILTELYHSCALIFDEVCVDGITPADYHDTINGEKFIGWIQTRLLPTFKQLYPGKKMYLILDNAKYHHHRGPDWFSPTNKKKGQLADFLRQREVKSITVDGGRVIRSSKFSADARGIAGGPTLEQLKAAVKQHLKEHPDINTTVPQQLMDDAGYDLLYTPPYVSQLQPIELIWAFTKSLVARQSHRTRTAHTATVQTREAMDKVTAELCKSVIAHSHAWIQQFMQSEEGGSLRRFLDLPMLMYARTEWLQAGDVAPGMESVAEIEEEEKQEEEEQTEARWIQ
jgi:transposase